MQIDYNATSPEVFCASLKRAREQKGIVLASISEATKIAESHFTALERGDLRHWPKGIFRRAFFRDYANAVGLPLELSLDAFTRLFPDEHDIGAEDKAKAAKDKAEALSHADPVKGVAPVPLRMTIEPARFAARDIGQRLLRVVIDAGIVLTTALIVAMLTPITLSIAAASLAIPYYSVRTLFAGYRVPRRRVAKAQPESDVAAPRRWISDARRIPGLVPQMRVRIKVTR